VINVGKTIVEKILAFKSGKDVKPGEIIIVEPDRVMSHDNSAFIIKKFKETLTANVWNRQKIVIIFDHCVPAILPQHTQNHIEAEQFAHDQDLPNFLGAAGVSHQVMMENGYVLPGQLNLGADSHSTIYGALNNLGIPINRTEMAGVWATGKIWLKVPDTIKISLNGILRKGVYAKDIMLYVLSKIRADGATYKVIEWHGEAVSNMSISARMTLANMSVELGAKAGIMEFDQKTAEYLGTITSEKFKPVAADSDANYIETLEIDVGVLEPQIACPHTVDNVKNLIEVKDVKINQAYLGSCTNGRIEDLEIAAAILTKNKVHPAVTLNVYPASKNIMKEAQNSGILDTLKKAGAKIQTASCGPCFGAVGATLKDNEVCISSSNRNFCGRMGSKESYVYLSSPAVVAASCITGKITDPRCYL
jgi:3-isopropylmalate/(R)-2-methylmalate dehydratase large subunit